MRVVRVVAGSPIGIRRPGRLRRRVLLLAGCALLAALTSGCGGSTAPEPGEHEGKHDDVGAVLRSHPAGRSASIRTVAAPSAGWWLVAVGG